MRSEWKRTLLSRLAALAHFSLLSAHSSLHWHKPCITSQACISHQHAGPTAAVETEKCRLKNGCPRAVIGVLHGGSHSSPDGDPPGPPFCGKGQTGDRAMADYSLGYGGVGSGMDITGTVEQLVAADRTPATSFK